MLLRLFILVFALGAAGTAAWFSLKLGDRAPQTEVVREEMPTRDILVATGPISGGEVISPERLRWQAWPEPNLSEDFILRDDMPDAPNALSGSFVTRTFAAGEPIRPDQLMANNVNLMSTKIGPGMRAASVKISAENTAGGFILPGDRVDVIHTVTAAEMEGEMPRSQSQIIISNARVLAIDQTSVQTPEGSVLGETATLELTPAEAERVVAAEASGLLTLALRAVSDHGQEIETYQPRDIRTVRIHRGAETQTITLR